MIRSLPLALAALTLLAASTASAEDARVTYNPSTLATVEGRTALKRQISEAADRYCRVNQYEGTVASCHRVFIDEMNRQLRQQMAEVAKANETRQLTQR